VYNLVTEASKPGRLVDYTLINTLLNRSPQQQRHSLNYEAVMDAAKTHYFPKPTLQFDGDFTRLTIQDPESNTTIPIWKYVLAVMNECGLLL
jgi:hypothetical protein